MKSYFEYKYKAKSFKCFLFRSILHYTTRKCKNENENKTT